MSNSIDPDETAHWAVLSSLIWIYAVCKSLLLSPVAVKELKSDTKGYYLPNTGAANTITSGIIRSLLVRNSNKEEYIFYEYGALNIS